MRITFPSGATFRGTGFSIRLRAVATAGHCVYMQNQGGWARRVEVTPECDGLVQPYGAAKTIGYDIATLPGESGAPVYIKLNGTRYVVGIHNYGAATGNSATRVTLPAYTRLGAWGKA